MRTHRWLCIVGGVVAVGVSSSAAVAQLLGTVLQSSFVGPITNAPVPFTIYLPQGYEASTERLPVIYHLHGLEGTHNGPQISAVPASYEAARAAGLIGPAIIVFPDGYGDSFWADSARSNKPAETNIVRELIPHVDATYRTRAHRGGRAITGFSMGGLSTPTYLAKFPDVFSVSVQYDGSMATWDIVRSVRPDIAAEIYDNSEARFNRYSPWRWTQQNAAVLASSSAMRIIVGGEASGLSSNRAFRAHLLGVGITPEYVETGLPHNLPLLLQAQGANSWAFIQRHLSPPDPACPADFNRDGGVDGADVEAFFAAWEAAEPDADVNQDGGIDGGDVGGFFEAWQAGGC